MKRKHNITIGELVDNKAFDNHITLAQCGVKRLVVAVDYNRQHDVPFAVFEVQLYSKSNRSELIYCRRFNELSPAVANYNKME